MKREYPRLIIDLEKIAFNTRQLCAWAKKNHNAHIFGVTKVLCGHPLVAATMLRNGCLGIADSRIDNLARIRDYLTQSTPELNPPLLLLRLPALSECEEVVAGADISLNSEMTTLRALNCAAEAQNKIHQAIIMVDMGDLREGLWSGSRENWNDILVFFREALALPHLKIMGIGLNLACYGGVIPDQENMSNFAELKSWLEEELDTQFEIVSGGNSSAVPLLIRQQMPQGINSFRLGESIILGKNVIDRSNLPGTHQDAVYCESEIIELREKPSIPLGNTGQNAFGENTGFVDRGIRQRAILALGRQDVKFEDLIPCDPGHILLGASSDHLIVDVSDSKTPLAVGSILRFIPGYGALLALSTSPYVKTIVLKKMEGLS